VLPADDDFGGGAPAPAPSADPFADEDESEEESWDAAPAKPAKSAKPKTKLELAIEKREERERLAAAGGVADEPVEGETAEERKVRLEEAQKAADRDMAMDAFGDVSVEGAAEGAAEAARQERLEKLGATEDAEGEVGFAPMDPSASLADMMPDTEAEFALFMEKLTGATKFSADSEHAPMFMKEVLTRTFAHLESFEIAEVTTALKALHSEKLKEQRAKDGKKEKKVTKASSRAKLGNNATVGKKKGRHSHTGQDNDIRYGKYDDYDAIADRY